MIQILCKQARYNESNLGIKEMNAEAFNTGIHRVAEILRCTTVHQIKGALSKWYDGKIVGKCAMGVISCEVGLPLTQSQPNTPHTEEGNPAGWETILEHAGIPNEYAYMNYPFQGAGEYEARESRIGDHIVSLNDGNGYSFSAIADYLETTFIPE